MDNIVCGMGMVWFDDNFNSFFYVGNSGSVINIYYILGNVFMLIDYSIYDVGGVGMIMVYMVVNLSVGIVNKIYDGIIVVVI